ncbi:unannotated protein [freshwater metagenome]|uniref:Unannotated protein n=1 Tax=freshwater metagenome TaxID=449393 RepID=A0A6J7VGC6_9ZZZZ
MIQANGTTSGTEKILKPRSVEYAYSPNGHDVATPILSMKSAKKKVKPA